MDLPPDLAIVHEPVRLRIVGLLYQHNDIAFRVLREALQLTPGNLGSHLARLEAAGLVKTRDALGRGGFEKRVALTEHGVSTFDRYLGVLEAFLAIAREPAPADRAPPRWNGMRRAALSVGGLFIVGEGLQQFLSEASGSSYGGILVSGAVLAGLAVFTRSTS